MISSVFFMLFMLQYKNSLMRGREFPSASWQILSWITMEYYAMLLSMNEGRPCHQSVNKRVKWLGALTVLLFLLGTGLFSFLWNVPLNTLRPAHAIAAPSAILVRENSSPERCRMALEPSFLASIQPFLKHYVETVTNAGRLDFSSHVPQEVEIRMEGLSIGLSPSLAVFNFRTKYGFSMQTSRKPDASDRAIYQWLKNRMKAEKREK